MTISKLLIANRGEIALRVMRSARQMGIATVAVHSTADADAEHVRAADQAVCIGGAAPAQSYLRVDAIIDAARATGADAIHPGYGFLAENPALPRACAENGLIFVGPEAQVMHDMGDKARAKDLMAQAGLPCIPGYQGADQSPATLAAQADQIGFPVMIKATAGGGGRGMRLVQNAGEFAAQLASAQSEARTGFGDDRVLLEKAIVDPRHVEIQIMGDSHGNAVHLGERDCSVQRRHQKLIEEAPSPAVDAELRQRMGQAAVQAVQALGYVGAGTFEFLLDRDGAFYFMEMNTRLQVEHPVTEAITGLDLVALQLRVAAGEALPITQGDINLTGHAIEVRICAEDPAAGFLPQSGHLALWQVPDGVRVDHALRSGSEIPPHYDSMMAKVIAHAPTRDAARQQLRDALTRLGVFGIATNRDVLGRALQHPIFARGQTTTGFIDTYGDELLHQADSACAAALAAVLSRLGPDHALRHRFAAPVRLNTGVVRVQAHRDGITAQWDTDQQLHLSDIRANGATCQFTLDGVRDQARFLAQDGRLNLDWRGRIHVFDDLTHAPATRGAGPASDGRIRASMTGTVAAIAVAKGDQVSAGQTVLVLEAMKMEHAHTAPIDGTVTAVNTATGDQVGTGTVLIELAPVPTPAN